MDVLQRRIFAVSFGFGFVLNDKQLLVAGPLLALLLLGTLAFSEIRRSVALPRSI